MQMAQLQVANACIAAVLIADVMHVSVEGSGMYGRAASAREQARWTKLGQAHVMRMVYLRLF